VLTRTATQGPELGIVGAFIDRGIRPSKGDMAVSVFCEPLLETGYPDVVVVNWTCRFDLPRHTILTLPPRSSAPIA
jgi:hypothetical protein